MAIKMPLVLQSTKVILRSFARKDITEEYIGWLNNPEITRYSNQRFLEHTAYTCERYLESIKLPSHFLKIMSSDGVAVGTSTIHVNAHHKTADIGLLIGKNQRWGEGFGTESVRLMIEYIKNDLDIRKITAGTLAINVGMRKVLFKNGMQEEAVRKGQELIEGRPTDMIHYCMFTDQIKENKSTQRA